MSTNAPARPMGGAGSHHWLWALLLSLGIAVAPAPLTAQARQPARATMEGALPVFFEPLPDEEGPGFTALAGQMRVFIEPGALSFAITDEVAASSEAASAAAVSTPQGWPHARGPGQRALNPASGHLPAEPAEAGQRWRHVVRMGFRGSDRAVQPVGIDPLPGRTSYLVGSDPTRWRRQIQHFRAVKYANLYPGVDLIVYGNEAGRLEYDFDIAPDADLSQIELQFEGMDGFAESDDGGLDLRTRGGTLRHRAPRSHEMDGPIRRPVQSHYRVDPGGSVRFEVPGRVPGRRIVIDPEVIYESASIDGVYWSEIAVDNEGSAYLGGYTSVTNVFETTPGAFQESGDAGLVLKVDPSGTVEYATFLGTGAIFTDIAVNTAKQATVVGVASIVDPGDLTAFPVKKPYFTPSLVAGKDYHVAAVLTPDGSDLVVSTYLRDEAEWAPIHVALDALSNVYVVGRRSSESSSVGTNFLMELTPGGAVREAQLGSAVEFGDIRIDPMGNILIAGRGGAGMPVANSYQAEPADFQDAYLAKLRPTGELVFATYLGGSDGELDAPRIAVDGEGSVYLAGNTLSLDFPVHNAWIEARDPTCGPTFPPTWTCPVPYAAKFGADGTIEYATYLGTLQFVNAAVADESGQLFVGGSITVGPAYPDVQLEGWLAKLNREGAVVSSDVFENPDANFEYQIAGLSLDDFGSVYAVGALKAQSYSEWALVTKLDGESFPMDPSCRDCPIVGKPVNVYTGNTWLDQVDVAMPGKAGSLALSRSYNSLYALAGRGRLFGRGWTSSYEANIRILPTGTLVLEQSDGVPIHFQDLRGDGVLSAAIPSTETSTITLVDGRYRRAFRQGGFEEYDHQGRLVRTVDATGGETTLSWTALSLSIVDAGGRAIHLLLDEQGRASSLGLGPASGTGSFGASPEGPLATYRYHPSGELAEVEYPYGQGDLFSYEQRGLLISIVNRLTGEVLESHSYDSEGRGKSSAVGRGQGFATGVQERLLFDYSPGLTTVTDQLGRTTTYEWIQVAGMKKVTRRAGPCDSCGAPGSESEEWTYYPDGRAKTYKNGAGETTRYKYNEHGDLKEERDDLNRIIEYGYTYDPDMGRILTQTRAAPGQGTTTWTYGVAGPETIVEQVTESVSRQTVFTYGGNRVETITDPRMGPPTTYSYWPTGDLQKVTDPEGNETLFGYDSMGRRTSVVDPENNETKTEYDRLGRVTKVINPDTTYTEFKYDASGRRSKVIDSLRRETIYSYDEYGRLETVTDPLKGVTRYAYDAMSNLVKLTDAKKQATQFHYDGFNRVDKVTYPDMEDETFTYDGAGRLATRTDRNGVTTTYSYDAVGRLEGKSHDDGLTPPLSFTYDAADRMETAANGDDALTWTYDLAGQVQTEASTANGSLIGYVYDLAGNRTSLSMNGVPFLTYSYDEASRLDHIWRGTDDFHFIYDKASRRKTMDYPNGVQTSYSYDDNSRLLQVAASLAGAPITSHGYGYDDAGNRTSKTTLDYQETYGYDELYRLTRVDRAGAGANHWAYGYDAVGNRVRQQDGGELITPGYNNRNQLQQSIVGGSLLVRGTVDEAAAVWVDGQPARQLEGNVFEVQVQADPGLNTFTVRAVDGSGNETALETYETDVSGVPATYGYDNSGNLISKTVGGEVWTYEWNAEGQLTRVLKDSVEVAAFKYDPTGRRIEKSASGVSTLYAYDNSHILRAIRSESGVDETTLFIQGPSLDEPLAREAEATGEMVFFHADGLGSVAATTLDDGTVSSTSRYGAWGVLEAGMDESGFAFTGREWDPEIGLYYYRARYYDPEAGRFISEDPLGTASGTSLFTYVDNRPADLVDPSGLTTIAFKISDGRLRVDPETEGLDVLEIDATSGKGEYLNDPEAVELRDRGPIPPGRYRIFVKTVSAPGKIGVVARYLRTGADWGSFRAALVPSMTTNTFERDGFYLHGGQFIGSAGCIDAGGGLFGDEDTERILEYLRLDPDGIVEVIVEP